MVGIRFSGWSLGLRGSDFEVVVSKLEFRVSGSGCRVQGMKLGVISQGSGVEVEEFLAGVLLRCSQCSVRV